jgi:chromosome segregation ATPase
MPFESRINQNENNNTASIRRFTDAITVNTNTPAAQRTSYALEQELAASRDIIRQLFADNDKYERQIALHKQKERMNGWGTTKYFGPGYNEELTQKYEKAKEKVKEFKDLKEKNKKLQEDFDELGELYQNLERDRDERANLYKESDKDYRELLRDFERKLGDIGALESERDYSRDEIDSAHEKIERLQQTIKDMQTNATDKIN